MKKETQRTKDLIEADLDYMINSNTQLTMGKHLLGKYVQLEQIGDTKEIERIDNPENLKDYCKKSMRFLKEARIKWAQVEWDLIGEWLKEQPKAEEWTQAKIDEYISYL
jgi:hypothetical protein